MQELSGARNGAIALEPVAGGCIHQAFRLRVGTASYFLKCNEAGQAENFAAEADGLAALGAADLLRVPAPLARGVDAGMAWLLLEWLDLAPLGRRAAARLGEALAALHAAPRTHYGWPRDNYIGATGQENGEDDDWCRFFRERRLKPQLTRARAAGLLGAADAAGIERIAGQLGQYFPDGAAAPALLHGDLWSGNAAQDTGGKPVVFDPAVYCGDPEADLAMMDLFGGFPAPFWAAYHAVLPQRAGHEARRDLYQLYHVLNHVNLFGAGYVGQARSLISRLAARL